jgi:hypothetical protein
VPTEWPMSSCYNHVTSCADAHAGETPEGAQSFSINTSCEAQVAGPGASVRAQAPQTAKPNWEGMIPEWGKLVLTQQNHKSQQTLRRSPVETSGTNQEPGTSTKWRSNRSPATADNPWLEQESHSNPVRMHSEMHSRGCVFCNVDSEARDASECIHSN